MTLKELNQLLYLRRELETLRRIREVRLAHATTQCQRPARLPRAPGKTDRVGDGAAALADIDAKIGRLLRRCERETERLLDFIAACPDSHVRTIMELRFLKGKSWTATAHALGGKNTASGCVMAVQRYLAVEAAKKQVPAPPSVYLGGTKKNDKTRQP